MTYDLRRHMLIHDKVRVIVDDQKKTKPKQTKETKDEERKKANEPKTDEGKLDKPPPEEKKENCRVPILKSLLDKKQAKMTHKKSPKKPPNVTIQNRDFKMTDDYDMLERQDQYKFKEVYTQKDGYTDELVRNDRDIELRPSKSQAEIESRLVYRENTDGKMHVYTQIEKPKDYDGPIVTNTVSLTDLKGLDKDVRDPRTDLHGESIENGFFERLSAFYNIPAV